MMTRQEIFDTVYLGLKAQNFERSTSRPESTSPENCLYRHGDLKCAFGHLIPDEQYDPELETKSAEGLLGGNVLKGAENSLRYAQAATVSRNEVEIAEYNHQIEVYTKFKEWSDATFDPKDHGFIGVMQGIHDCALDTDAMKKTLIDRAFNEGLEVPD